MNELPQYQHIEDAFKAPAEVLGRIPEDPMNIPRKRAIEHLEIAEQLAYQARERAKVEE